MTWTFEAVLARGKAEILADIAAGIVPGSVRDFAVLHDYVDANGYGGAFEETAPFWNSEGHLTDEGMDFWNRVQDELHEWLKGGRA